MSANLSRRSFIAGSAAMGGMMLGVSSSAEAKFLRSGTSRPT